MLVDVGVGTYTAKTFSAERYSIWTCQSSYHNLPEINGIGQQAGRRYRASSVDVSLSAEHAQLGLDLAAAYPAGVLRWSRTARLDRGTASVTIVDEWELAEPATVVFNLMTPASVRISSAARLELTVGERMLAVQHDPAFAVTVDDLTLTDPKLTGVWGGVLRRIRLTRSAADAGRTGRHRIELSATHMRSAEVPA
jgi:hypothetical protein